MTGTGKTDKKFHTLQHQISVVSVTAFDLYHYSDQWSFS